MRYFAGWWRDTERPQMRRVDTWEQKTEQKRKSETKWEKWKLNETRDDAFSIERLRFCFVWRRWSTALGAKPQCDEIKHVNAESLRFRWVFRFSLFIHVLFSLSLFAHCILIRIRLARVYAFVFVLATVDCGQYSTLLSYLLFTLAWVLGLAGCKWI